MPPEHPGLRPPAAVVQRRRGRDGGGGGEGEGGEGGPGGGDGRAQGRQGQGRQQGQGQATAVLNITVDKIVFETSSILVSLTWYSASVVCMETRWFLSVTAMNTA